jgi:hypothetical protein
MAFVDLYPATVDYEGSPDDARGADGLVYRLAFRRMAVAGLPESVALGPVVAHFIQGPLRTQVTTLRQRAGWPPVFDKHMERGVEVGEDELLTVFELPAPAPDDDLAQAIAELRAGTLNAVGVLCATLDERIALEQVAEDVILMDGGVPFAAADLRSHVRTFMPFDVTDDDRTALSSLSGLDLDGHAAYAASLLAAGASYGPSPTGFLLLWLAIDAVVATRKTQKAAVAQALADAGANLSWLSLPLGQLTGLRGPLAHGRAVDPHLLRQGYYDSEAIARVLVRKALGITGGWPAMPNATAFPLPAGRRIATEARALTEEWHEDGLPTPDDEPAPLGLPRLDAVMGGQSQWLGVVGVADADVEERIRFWAMAAVNAVDVEVEPFEIRVEPLPDGHQWGVNRESIRMAPDVAAGPNDEREPRMAWQLCQLVAQMQVMRTGVESVDFGAFLIEFGGAWVAYREWVIDNEMPTDLLTRVDLNTASVHDIGATAGVAAAGDPDARRDIEAWIASGPASQAQLRGIVEELLEQLQGLEHFAEYLAFTAAAVEATRATARGAD